jgi:hypothetical protein
MINPFKVRYPDRRTFEVIRDRWPITIWANDKTMIRIDVARIKKSTEILLVLIADVILNILYIPFLAVDIMLHFIPSIWRVKDEDIQS